MRRGLAPKLSPQIPHFPPCVLCCVYTQNNNIHMTPRYRHNSTKSPSEYYGTPMNSNRILNIYSSFFDPVQLLTLNPPQFQPLSLVSVGPENPYLHSEARDGGWISLPWPLTPVTSIHIPTIVAKKRVEVILETFLLKAAVLIKLYFAHSRTEIFNAKHSNI